jgi:hypothetical protein
MVRPRFGLVVPPSRLPPRGTHLAGPMASPDQGGGLATDRGAGQLDHAGHRRPPSVHERGHAVSRGPPTVPEHNPTGLHRRRITSTDLRKAGHRRGDRVILHLGGAESATAIWLNGTFVGIASDSRLASEFDVTELIRPEVNELAVMVVRWSAWTWIEDQDHWFHGGIARRIALRTCGRTALADVSVSARLDSGLRRGSLEVSCRVDGEVLGWSVRTHLETVGGRRVAGTASEAPVSTLDVSRTSPPKRTAIGIPGRSREPGAGRSPSGLVARGPRPLPRHGQPRRSEGARARGRARHSPDSPGSRSSVPNCC